MATYHLTSYLLLHEIHIYDAVGFFVRIGVLCLLFFQFGYLACHYERRKRKRRDRIHKEFLQEQEEEIESQQDVCDK